MKGNWFTMNSNWFNKKRNWEEINKIIEESQPHKYMFDFYELKNTDYQTYEKVSFLYDEMRFPDNQPAVVESGTLFRKYLREKYSELSDKSIDKIVGRYLFLNK